MTFFSLLTFIGPNTSVTKEVRFAGILFNLLFVSIGVKYYKFRNYLFFMMIDKLCNTNMRHKIIRKRKLACSKLVMNWTIVIVLHIDRNYCALRSKIIWNLVFVNKVFSTVWVVIFFWWQSAKDEALQVVVYSGRLIDRFDVRQEQTIILNNRILLSRMDLSATKGDDQGNTAPWSYYIRVWRFWFLRRNWKPHQSGNFKINFNDTSSNSG